jgi:hypothetical protein
MHLGEAEMHVLNRPIFLFASQKFFRLYNVLNHMWAAHRPFITLFSTFVGTALVHYGYNMF